MRRAHTVEQLRAAEEQLFAQLPDGALMQRAAAGLAASLADFLGRVYGSRVLLLVGAGGNGGDALYAGARLASRGASVDAVLLDPERTHRDGLAAFRAAGGQVVSSPRPAYDVAVDGIVGIGATGPLRPEAESLVDSLVDSLGHARSDPAAPVPVVAVDVPSGIEVDTGRVSGPHVHATLTVTFGSLKVAHLVDPAASACGAVHLVDIGLQLPDPAAETLQPSDVAALLPRPTPDAHKYTRGVVGVRAGSEQYRGAAVLSAAGASCGLAGMVRYVPPEGGPGQHDVGVADLVQAAHPEVVIGPGQVQTWVVGSGGGSSAPAQLGQALSDQVPVVVDADALTSLTGRLAVPAVLTPHAGELARLLGVTREEVERDQLASARRAAEQYAAVVLLKGRHTLVVHPDGRVRVTTVGPPWLATAGSGDVLAGLVGALLAAGLEPFDAASVGSWVHGTAAALLRGPLTAGDVAGQLPAALRGLLMQDAGR